MRAMPARDLPWWLSKSGASRRTRRTPRRCVSPCSGAANQVTEAVQADYIGRMFTYRLRQGPPTPFARDLRIIDEKGAKSALFNNRTYQ